MKRSKFPHNCLSLLIHLTDFKFQVDSIIYATGFDLLASGYGFQVGLVLKF